MDYSFLLGFIGVVCGAVMLVYGATLFRFVLAFAGFYVGFMLTLTALRAFGESAPSLGVQYLLAVVVGAACGLVLYSLVKITVHAAGGMLGLVLGMLVASLLPVGNTWIISQIGLGAMIVGAVFGSKLGAHLTIYASALAGAYVTVTGLAVLFGMEAKNGVMPVDAKTLTVFAVFAVVSILAQLRVRHMRGIHLR